jgi:hypothetical protein
VSPLETKIVNVVFVAMMDKRQDKGPIPNIRKRIDKLRK